MLPVINAKRWRVLVLGVLLPLPALALSGAVLHERLPAGHNPAEIDGPLGTAVSNGSSGNAPRIPSTPGTRDSRGSPLKPVEAAESSFHPDRDTRRPDMLPYEDPFRPTVTPFKRLGSFDAIDASYTMSVADARLVPVQIATGSVEASREDRFLADMPLELTPDKPVRIPTPGPGARVVEARLLKNETTVVPFVLLQDSAENAFVVSSAKGKVHLAIVYAVSRESFGFEFGKPALRDLPRVPPLPAPLVEAATEVARHIGLRADMPPVEVVTKLVAYFRSFTDTEAPLQASRDIYRDLALSQKGVCRHRAFAFFVTARLFQIPTRVVTNEAHAWVEVHNGRLWKRIDLGGAGETLETSNSDDLHEAPPDGFEWPTSAARGDDAARRAQRNAQASKAGAETGTSVLNSASQNSEGQTGQSSSTAGDQNSVTTLSEKGTGAEVDAGLGRRPRTELTLNFSNTQASRGDPFHVSGTAIAEGEGCQNMIVSLVLSDSRTGGIAKVLGSFSTDTQGKGHFEGDVAVPPSFPTGRFDLTARTMGDAHCGPGVSP
jgi:transglutaminase-like putative cysteine protease